VTNKRESISGTCLLLVEGFLTHKTGSLHVLLVQILRCVYS